MTIIQKKKEMEGLGVVESSKHIRVVDEIHPKLLSVKQFCKYMDIGQTTARKLLSEPNCPYVFRIGGKIFANKTVLDKWIDSQTGR